MSDLVWFGLVFCAHTDTQKMFIPLICYRHFGLSSTDKKANEKQKFIVCMGSGYKYTYQSNKQKFTAADNEIHIFTQ